MGNTILGVNIYAFGQLYFSQLASLPLSGLKVKSQSDHQNVLIRLRYPSTVDAFHTEVLVQLKQNRLDGTGVKVH